MTTPDDKAQPTVTEGKSAPPPPPVDVLSQTAHTIVINGETIAYTATAGRLAPPDLDALCPDWESRLTLASGPGAMLDDLSAHWETAGIPDRLMMERFQPVIGGDPGLGDGGRITFTKSGATSECEAGTPILIAGEEAGVEMPFGCRMGICHTCVGQLCSGKLRDLRTGEVHGSEGEMVRTCVNAPEGPVEIKL